MKDSWDNINEEIEDLRAKDSPEYMIDVINCAAHYYALKSGLTDIDDPSESWKTSAGIVNHPVPEDLDQLIKSCLIKALKKYSK